MNNSFFDMITWFKKETKNDQDAIVVYSGDKCQKRSQGRVISWKDLEKNCVND